LLPWMWNLLPQAPLTGVMLNLFYYFTSLWMVCTSLGYTSLVDLFWPGAFLLVAWTCSEYNFGILDNRQQLAMIFVSVWALRLASYVAFKISLKRGEHPGYKAQQRKYGTDFWWVSFFTVFLFEIFQVFIISLPLINILTHISRDTGTFTPYDLMGIFTWCSGFYLETVADYQLYSFLSIPTNNNRILRTGLWSYCRHPNYLGEVLIWLGIFFINLNYPNGTYFCVSPIFTYLLLNHVTGVSVCERDMKERKADYHHYCKSTPQFFPSLIREEEAGEQPTEYTAGQ